MLIGYARVSKADGSQSLDLQRDASIASGVEEDQIYSDLASGKKDDRSGLEACLKALREGDVLVVWKLDRMGCSLQHLVKAVSLLSERALASRCSPDKARRSIQQLQQDDFHLVFLRPWPNLKAS